MQDWTPDELVRFSGSYWGICALHAAVRLDLFSALRDGPLPADELAARIGCSERGVEPLVAALCGLHLLVMEQGRAALTPFAREHLCRGSDAYLGYILNHHRQLMPGWARLDEAVRTGLPTRSRVAAAEDPEEREGFIMGMYNMASIRADQAVQAVDLSRCRRLLDLGGGPGAYSVRFCQANPGLECVIFDLPTSRPFAENVVSRHGLQKRIRFEGGDFFRDPLPCGFDAVWISHILHGMGDRESAKLVSLALNCLNPGGRILIQEFILDDTRDGPLFSALFGLNMLTGTPTGKAYTTQELTRLLEAAGARHVRRLPMEGKGGSGIVAGEKEMQAG